jgi:SOS-response transcriptional repressor LexA
MLKSKKQRIILDFIIKFSKKHGYVPSYREIEAALGYKSLSAIHMHIDNLVKAGYLKRRPNAARSLEVVQPTERSLMDRIDSAVQNANTRDVRALKRALELLGYDDIAKEL